MNKTVYDNIAWTYGRVMYIIFYDNMFSCLNFGFTTRAASRKIRKESLLVFSNGSMAGSHASEMDA